MATRKIVMCGAVQNVQRRAGINHSNGEVQSSRGGGDPWAALLNMFYSVLYRFAKFTMRSDPLSIDYCSAQWYGDFGG